MNNFKVNVTIDGVSRNVTVRRKESDNIKSKNSFDDTIDGLLDDLDLEKVSFNELVPKYEKIKFVSEDDCPICQLTYTKGEDKRRLHCNHEFHKKCIDKWLKQVLNCPLCRKEI